MGRNFKFQVQDSDLEDFFLEIWRFEKQISLSEKKPPLVLALVTHNNPSTNGVCGEKHDIFF